MCWIYKDGIYSDSIKFIIKAYYMVFLSELGILTAIISGKEMSQDDKYWVVPLDQRWLTHYYRTVDCIYKMRSWLLDREEIGKA